MSLSPAQHTITKDHTRFRVVVAGRRFGKTHLSIRELAKHARWPNQKVWYIAPTYRQAKNIAWSTLKNKLIDLQWCEKINESELTIYLKNSSTISLKGADNYDSLRGVGLDFVVLDEFADIDPSAWYETLRPTLSDRGGSALFIGTPKGVGNWSYEIFHNALESTDWSSYQFTTLDGGRVPQEEIDSARSDLDERTFCQEYLATFETHSGRVYYSFTREHNHSAWEQELPQVLHCGIDFNVDPMSCVIAVKTETGLHCVDEIAMFGSNTNELVDELLSRYPTQKIFAYPDPAGRQRKTSAAGQTDITILQNRGLVVKAPRRHTAVRDRINAVNSRICDSTGERHLWVAPSCKRTSEGLERQTYKPGTTQPDKESGLDHMMDALGYLVDALYPVRKQQEPSTQPASFAHRTGTTNDTRLRKFNAGTSFV